ALVAAAHRHGGVILHFGDLRKALGTVLRQVVAAFGHELDGPGVDAPRRAGAGAVRLDALAAMEPGEGLGHLAAVAVLDADEEDAPRRGDNRGHAHDSFAATLQR